MIRRYATPYEYFVLPFASKDIANIKMVYTQNGEKIVEKLKSDITIADIDDLDNASMGEDFMKQLGRHLRGLKAASVISVHLTQEETASFTFYKAAEKNIALIQIHLVDMDGDSFMSRPIRVRIYGSTDEGVL